MAAMSCGGVSSMTSVSTILFSRAQRLALLFRRVLRLVVCLRVKALGHCLGGLAPRIAYGLQEFGVRPLLVVRHVHADAERFGNLLI